MLWASNLPTIENGSWAISIGALQLPAGAEGQLDQPLDGALVIYSAAGLLRLETRAGEISKLDQRFWPVVLGTTSSLDAGQAAEIEETELLGLRSETGATIWVISIVPVDPVAAPVAAPVAGGSPEAL